MAVLLIAAALLFIRLGYYPLWDDEAATALNAQAVWRTGDTSVILDHNIVAYRQGLLVRDLHERSTPPLATYIAAPMYGILGGSALTMRLPFALMGLAVMGWMFCWLHRCGDCRRTTWIILGIAMIGTVSLVLYTKQCRYYAPAILSSLGVAYYYVHWDGRKRTAALLGLWSLLLLASNYLNFAALWGCVLVDWLIVARRHMRLTPALIALAILPSVLIGGCIVWIFNPLSTGQITYTTTNSLLERLQFILLNLRDLNTAEYLAGGLLLACPIACFRTRNVWLWRAPLALAVYVTIISFLSPQVYSSAIHADVRYLAPAIPLCIGIGVLVIASLDLKTPIAIGLALLAFCTNILHGAFLQSPGPYRSPQVRSTIGLYLAELVSPPLDCYSPAIEWIRQNVQPRESVWTIPDYKTYPLMHHAPHAVYAWQLSKPVPAQFSSVDPIHIQGERFPDYILVFGPPIQQIASFKWPEGIHYEFAGAIDAPFVDAYRAELFWHVFQTPRYSIENGTAIYILKRVR